MRVHPHTAKRESETESETIVTQLERRALGNTGIELSVLGMGGFHQVEVPQTTVDAVMSRYLAAGGNYIETARGYGRGASEKKLGRALAGVPRERFVLASKSGARRRDAALADIDASLENLQTDYMDLYFFHGVNRMEEIDAICACDGALAGFEKAKAAGKIRGFALSSHWPQMYIEAAKRLPLDAVLIWGNYLDFCNFPEIPRRVIPFLRERGIGIIFMKPLADGFLYRSPRDAIRYALSQDTDCLVAGFNSTDMLETDLEACASGAAGREEVDAILRDAPELGDTVCRQCERCTVLDGEDGVALKRLFELEGKVDRQMDPLQPVDAARYALKERLKGWFGSADRARQIYADEGAAGNALRELHAKPCRYGIDIPRKIGLAHAKLTDPESVRML
jgi:aryl-alcohol dehydrogenase-like predicted oxidoreductase